MKAPKEGSSKRKVWDVFTDKGADAAMKMQGKVPVGDSTVRSWIAEWTRNAGGTPPAAPKKAGKTSQVKREKLPEEPKKPGEFYPRFDFLSRDMCEARIAARCKSNGDDPRIFHVLEEDGKFAIVPAHFKPTGPIPQFKKGDQVYIMGMSNSKATVQEPGPQASVIKYQGPPIKGLSRPDTECVSNVYILKFEGKPYRTAKERMPEIAADAKKQVEKERSSKTKGKSPTRERL